MYRNGMTVFLYSVLYIAAVVFILGCIVRVLVYAKAPIHLRWELYPIPHEEPGRAKHGGSYFEETDWWTKSSRFGLMGEVRFMVPEILFLRGLYEFNRSLWLCSFPFHFGLYLLAVAMGLVGAGSILSTVGPAPGLAALVSTIRHIYPLAGTLGLFLAMLGALGLVIRRLTDESLKIYTTPADVFNLLFFLVTLVVLSTAWLTKPASAPDLLAIVKGALTLDTSLHIPGLLVAGLLLAALLIAYIPLTHMSHFIAKFFTYHAVRWDDAPNARGGKIEARLAEYLTYRPTWSAAHVGADGKRTWAQVAASRPGPEAKK
jgi:nitrate reductase gamma subunit